MSFDELGLREELVDAVEEADFPRPTELQAAAVPVLRRGNNAVLHASSGAGVTAAWGLALLDRLAEEEIEPEDDGGVPVRALVLTPTEHAAARAAAQLAPFASAAGLRVLAVAAGWAPAGGVADVVIATPESALEAVSASRLKLSDVRALVLSDADLLLEQASAALDTLTAALPATAQRVVATGDPAAARDYVERHVRKALHLPRIDDPEGAQTSGVVAYVVAPERDRLETLARLVDENTGPPLLIFCRTDERASQVADGLAARGFDVGPAGEEGADVAVVAASVEDVDVEGRLPCSLDVPSGPEEMRARHGGGGMVLLEARELPHLERTAGRVGLAIRARREPLPASLERA
ncbi:MAG TPA: DEAD/DEAH box helicase, partial [Longimicrobiales bacterium]|nr:DEAD/DEAH box helicase [Longimicrobiales bacterium]